MRLTSHYQVSMRVHLTCRQLLPISFAVHRMTVAVVLLVIPGFEEYALDISRMNVQGGICACSTNDMCVPLSP